MIVCHCKAVTDCQIRNAVAAGASTVQDIARLCGAGQHCLPCRNEVAEIIRQERQAREQGCSGARKQRVAA